MRRKVLRSQVQEDRVGIEQEEQGNDESSLASANLYAETIPSEKNSSSLHTCTLACKVLLVLCILLCLGMGMCATHMHI